VLKKLVAAAIATLALGALGALGAAEASAANDAGGSLMISTGGSVGDFRFDPDGEKVELYDAQPDNWGMLLELWWGGKLRRWCYNTKGASTFQRCDFKIPEGRNITFYLAEISHAWFNCKRQGCGKRRHMWAGPSSHGCAVAPKGWPCGYPGELSPGIAPDFRGEA
jgi:hypothetical protein